MSITGTTFDLSARCSLATDLPIFDVLVFLAVPRIVFWMTAMTREGTGSLEANVPC